MLPPWADRVQCGIDILRERHHDKDTGSFFDLTECALPLPRTIRMEATIRCRGV